MPAVDVVVVGGGVHGTAVAYELARSGLSVTLLERRTLASGASGGPGFRGVRANGRDLRELPLMRLAYDIWPALDTELGRDSGYRRVGGLELFEQETVDDEVAMARLRSRIAAQNALGIPTELIDRDRLLELEPGTSDAVVGAVLCPLDGCGDHGQTTRSYAAAAADGGATVVENAEVVRIVAADLDSGHGGGGQVITVDGTVHSASRAVIVLANSYTPALLRQAFGLDLPIWRFNPQVVPVRARDGFTVRHLISHVTRTFAAKTIDGGAVMLSGGRRGSWDEALDAGFADPDVPAASLADAEVMFPALADAEVVLTDASRPESVSVDDIPIIDRVPGARSVFFGTGWSGHGFAIAPAVARLLAEWVRSTERPAELAPFALARVSRPSTTVGSRADGRHIA